MKRLFFGALTLLALFELACVYFIMPLPGSQHMRSIDLAYALYRARWWVRAVCGASVALALPFVWRGSRTGRIAVATSLVALAAVLYLMNFQMSADRIFLAPRSLDLRPAARNTVPPTALVVGVTVGGESRAYPIRFLGYHHQVRDAIGGRPILVSYCTVCRTGRVFDPIVDGRNESFRLVGMDHFNAMFEDASTGSWWRQANGEAIVGPRKGCALRELASQQVRLAQWLAVHPNSLVMQADSTLLDRYGKNDDYETGKSRKALTGTDTISWHDKAWVVGLTVGGESKAYDWNRLRRERVVNDEVGGTPVVLALASDSASFFAYRRPDNATTFVLASDTLVGAGKAYVLGADGTPGSLPPLQASQEFWHSWRTFHPGTKTY
jgi:uncharacterized protein DUF3179